MLNRETWLKYLKDTKKTLETFLAERGNFASFVDKTNESVGIVSSEEKEENANEQTIEKENLSNVKIKEGHPNANDICLQQNEVGTNTGLLRF